MRLLLAATLAVALGVGCKKGALASDFRMHSDVPRDADGFALALYQTTGTQFTEGNLVEWVDNGAVFDRIREDIESAKSSVNIVLFIWRAGPPGDALGDALVAAVKRGVKCRVLVDPIGSTDFAKAVQPKLSQGGCDTRIFRPLPADESLARNHRKIVTVDGRVSYTGGFAFQEPWLGDARNVKEWRDVAVRVRGPVVAQLQQAFAENWQEMGGAFLPQADFAAATEGPLEGGVRAAFISSTPNPEVTRAERIVQLLARSARSQLWIEQAYFTPNQPLLEVLRDQAKAGVDVRVVAPGEHNDHKSITRLQRMTYRTLLPAGVRVYEWPVSMLHSKTILVDGRLTFIGSMNFDLLSYRFLEEGSLLVDDPVFAARAAKAFRDDAAKSEEIKE